MTDAHSVMICEESRFIMYSPSYMFTKLCVHQVGVCMHEWANVAMYVLLAVHMYVYICVQDRPRLLTGACC
jgi:hypothetical protein